MTINPVIEESWKRELADQFAAPYFAELKSFLVAEKQQYAVYPPGPLIFNAFNLTPFDKVKVVIIGQDPYHEPGQAHGLCFSVQPGTKFPPSLVNIFQELHTDLGMPIPQTGNLEGWARQGVLLLNATLTVRAHLAGSHQRHGWELFTDAAIQRLSEKRNGLVFLLWGSYAQAKVQLIDTSRHYVLMAPHPSPLSAYRGFFGCKHFSKTNEILLKNGIEPIHWEMTGNGGI
jgi:uracil-DNA glycosylase